MRPMTLQRHVSWTLSFRHDTHLIPLVEASNALLRTNKKLCPVGCSPTLQNNNSLQHCYAFPRVVRPVQLQSIAMLIFEFRVLFWRDNAGGCSQTVGVLTLLSKEHSQTPALNYNRVRCSSRWAPIWGESFHQEGVYREHSKPYRPAEMLHQRA